MESRVYGDLTIKVPEAILYLLKGDYRFFVRLSWGMKMKAPGSPIPLNSGL